MFSKGKNYSLAMMQRLGKQQTMLVFRLCTDNNLLNYCIFLVGYTYYVIKEYLIEAFWGRDVFYTFNDSDVTYNSIQRNIVCLIWFTIRFTKHEPTAIILLQVLWMEYQFKRFLSEALIGKS